MSGTFLDDIQVDFLIEATQASSTSRSLQAPRITLINGSRAYINVSTVQYYVADYEVTTTGNTQMVTPEPGTLQVGTFLSVKGTVSADRRYVTLDVRPEITSLLGLTPFTSFVIGAASAGDTSTTTAVPITIQLPQLSSTSLQTTVTVPDGGTLLLGGLKLAGEIEREKGVPLLSKIPIIRRFFDSRGTVRDESILLILIKPKIIIQQEEEERAFP